MDAASWVVDLSSFQFVRRLSNHPLVSVALCEDRTTGFRIAVKGYSELNSQQEQLFFCEIEALMRFDDPCIVPFFGYVLPTEAAGPKIATHFMAGGSLADVLGSGAPWWDGTAKSIIVAGIVEGMMKIHAAGVIHRDLKPSNVLLDADHRPRICDFGSSRDLSVSGTLTAEVGTPFYMAPELFEGEEYNEKVDVYSFALLLYEVVVGHPAFPATLTIMQLCRWILAGRRPDIPPGLRGFVCGLIRRCWSSRSEERPEFTEIYEVLRVNNFCVEHNGFDPQGLESYRLWLARQRRG
jgi:serine/threonine protein kinase